VVAQVVLPRSLVALVPAAERRTEVAGGTVVDVLRGLDQRWPGILDRVCDPGPVLRQHLNVYVDGERATLSTPVGAGSTLHVIPAVSGGSAIGRASSHRPRHHPGS
jgi:molybdopterin converting factor small subunit